MTRITRMLGAGLRELTRTPVLVVLLFFLPAYLVGVFTFVAPDVPVALQLPDGTTSRVSLTDAMPTFITPMAAALLTAITGLFVMRSSTRADARLVLAGYEPYQVALARLGLLSLVGGLATVFAVEGLGIVAYVPEEVALFYAATLLTALVYGALGMLAGILLDRLAGVYLILFGAIVDLFVFQNPIAKDPPAAAVLLPGHYPMELAMAAGFSQSVPGTAVWGSLGMLGIATLLAVGGLYASVEA